MVQFHWDLVGWWLVMPSSIAGGASTRFTPEGLHGSCKYSVPLETALPTAWLQAWALSLRMASGYRRNPQERSTCLPCKALLNQIGA